MEIFIILLMVLVAVLIIVFAVVSHIKKTERLKYYAAAGNILREDFLNYALQNPACSDKPMPEPNGRKMMICLKSKCRGKKAQFVFDPEKKIYIGRDKYKSNIYIDNVFVSQEHCCIYSSGDNRVYLLDLNAVNGTELRRGALKKYAIFGGCQIELKSGDRIIIGGSSFKATLFYYDMSVN